MAEHSDIEILTKELIAAFKTCDDTQFVVTANQGLYDLNSAVEKREIKYQDLIREMSAKTEDARTQAHMSADVVDQAVYDARVTQQEQLASQIEKARTDKMSADRVLKDMNSSHQILKQEATKER